MIKSVWLTNLIISSLSDAGSLLYSYYTHLINLVNAKESLLCLREPDGADRTYIMISRSSACLLPIPDGTLDGETAEAARQKREALLSNGTLYLPLFFENVDSFGIITVKNVSEMPGKESLESALIAFSSVLYAESMGSIVRSFHDTVMHTEKVCVDYQNGKLVNRVVKNVDLNIYEKEFTVIVGASGSGKSSLLNVLGGMLTPSRGKAFWHDTPISDMTEKERTAYRGSTVGFVFQRYNLISDLTAEENIKIAASLVKDPLPVSEVLEMVGLSDKAGSYPSQLSGGEQQRVCIARALVKRAKILLCDEPTGALDTENAASIIKILKNIAKNNAIPVVVITHNPSLVVLADHCITISNGMVVEDILQPFAFPAEALKLR